MEQRWDFLKQGETSLGVFYPLHYLVAGYPGMEEARQAENAFRDAGVADEDVRAASGRFVAEQLEQRPDRNMFEKLENQMAKVIGTEKNYVTDDQRHAGRGGAFVFVFAPEDADVERARNVFATHPPVFARRYLRVAIQEVVEYSGSAGPA